MILGGFHVDEIDHHQAAEIAQAELTCDFVGRFAIGPERSFLNVVALGGARRIDVDRYECFGVVDDDCATGRQRDIAPIRGFDLMLDLEAREQRNVVVIQLHLADVGRHDGGHERLRLLEYLWRVDQDFADVGLEQIANRAHHEARFEVNQFRAFDFFRGTLDGFPQLNQVIHIPLELFGRASDAGCAGDDAHAFGNFKLIECLAQLGAVLAFNAARNTATARIVGHQHQVTAGQ